MAHLGTFRSWHLVYMVAVKWLVVLIRMIGIFFGLSVFELLCNLAVVFVAVYVVLPNIRLVHRRYLLHPGRGGGGRLNVVHILLLLLAGLYFHLVLNW